MGALRARTVNLLGASRKNGQFGGFVQVWGASRKNGYIMGRFAQKHKKMGLKNHSLKEERASEAPRLASDARSSFNE